MRDEELILIALKYFKAIDNQRAYIFGIFPKLDNSYTKNFLESVLLKYPDIFECHEITSAAGLGRRSYFNLLPHVYTEVVKIESEEYLKTYFQEIKYIEHREKLEVSQMQSVIETNKLQKGILWLTAFLSAATLIISVITLFKKESINVAPAAVILQPVQPSKDSMIRLIQSLMPQKDTTMK
jgi:hypothetical protein